MVGRNHHSGTKTTTTLLKPRTLEAKVCIYTGLTVKCIIGMPKLADFTPVLPITENVLAITLDTMLLPSE